MANFNQTISNGANDGGSDGSNFSTSGTTKTLTVGAALLFRFTGVTIPPGASINSAALSVFVTLNSGTVAYKVDALDEDNAAMPADQAEYAGRTHTTAAATGTTAATGAVTTVDFASVIQEIVDRPGWASGNSIVICLRDNGNPASFDVIAMEEHATAAPAALAISYGSGAEVTDCSPDTGTIHGGTSVTITGSNFTAATGATFGGVSATGFSVDDDSTITCDTPSHAAGAVDVVVQHPDGDGTLEDGFTYETPAPTLSSIDPDNGTIEGGTEVTLTGVDFTDTTGVTFDGDAATDVNVVSDTEITCVTPAHDAGAVDVVVTTPAGSDTLAGGFTYFVPGSGSKQGAGISLSISIGC